MVSDLNETVAAAAEKVLNNEYRVQQADKFDEAVPAHIDILITQEV